MDYIAAFMSLREKCAFLENALAARTEERARIVRGWDDTVARVVRVTTELEAARAEIIELRVKAAMVPVAMETSALLENETLKADRDACANACVEARFENELLRAAGSRIMAERDALRAALQEIAGPWDYIHGPRPPVQVAREALRKAEGNQEMQRKEGPK